MFIGTRQKTLLLPSNSDICLDGHRIERVDSYKCLGILVDETLSWGTHISEVNRKVSKVLAALKSLCPQPVLITIYKSLILPQLDYCSAAWGGTGTGLSNKLEKLQIRAPRIIVGADWDVRSSFILSDLNWTSLADRPSKQIKTLMFKTVNDLLPEYIFERFANTNTVHRIRYNLRKSVHPKTELRSS